MKFGNDIFIGDEIITIHGVTGVIIRYNKESYEYTIVNIDKQKGRVYYVPECEVTRTTGKYCPQILDLFDNGADWKLASGGSCSSEIKKDEDLSASELYTFTKGLMAFGRCVQELRRFENDDWVKFAKLAESYQLKISVPEVATDVTILDRLLEDNRPDKIYEAYRCYKKAIADEKWKNMNRTNSAKFKKGDMVISKDESYNDPDIIIVTRTYYAGNDEKFDGYSKSDGRAYIALFADWYRLVESADEKDEVESGEDNLCYVDRLWSNLRKICFGLPYADIKRLFGDMSFTELIQKYDPDEIMSIMEEYNNKRSNLTPGDEIHLTEEDELVVVTSINTVHEIINVITKDGVIDGLYFTEGCWEKTGKHYSEMDTLLKIMKYRNEHLKNKKENDNG